MLYVLVEIAILLLIAIALGLLVGWLLWRWRRVNLSTSDYRRLLEERQQLDEERLQATRQRNDMEQQMLGAQRDRDRSLQLVADREQELTTVREREQRTLAEHETAGEAGGSAGGSKLFGAAAAGGAVGLGGATFLTNKADDGSAPPPPAPEAGSVDDLTAINGVGSELESFLQEHGLWNYRQLAALTDDEIDALQLHLPQFPNRIRNDDWVGQARHLHYERYGRLPEG